jgi:hypothetical protein
LQDKPTEHDLTVGAAAREMEMKRLMTMTCAAFSLVTFAHAQSPDDYDEGIAAGQLGTALYNLANPDRALPMPAADVSQDSRGLQRAASTPNSTGSGINPVADTDRKKSKPYAQ